ncbi:SCP2 sterol-binding domain-containing protein [Patulibacter defluvii]|uniref:SCP2 sterol-binding domain-containing protein n=1 Tax=Patulibacter defluvii TaxID=3095358 RepID=UPI002A765A79|nr:SCP2 sterol-binding domain-containing protein [Patulibacter sp. DM4]
MQRQTVDPQEFVQRLEAFFARAAQQPELAERMSFARTTVALHLTDAPEGTGCTLYLAGTPIEARAGVDERAEIHLRAPTPLWLDMLADRLPLPIAVAQGKVEYSGPVRKFLRVAPILKGFDFDVWRGQVGSAPDAVPNPGMDAALGRVRS